VVLEELRGVLRRKFGVPAKAMTEIDSFLRGYQVQPKSRELPGLKLGDRNDLLVTGSALKAEAEILVTGDQEMLELDEKPEGLQIVSPREFWNLAAGRGKGRV
jgi:predicted nucleic acid-binding protein